MDAKAIKNIPTRIASTIAITSAGEVEKLGEELGEDLTELECPATSAAGVPLTMPDKVDDGETLFAVELGGNNGDAAGF